mgnify:CR=1 FL=1
MSDKRKKGRWGKLGIDTKSRSWLKEEFPIKELISELVADGQVDIDQLIKRFKHNKYPVMEIHKNLGRIARLGRDIRRREEIKKNTDSRKVFDESRDLIRKWKDELKSRKWLVNKVSKKIDISNKGAIRYQNRNGKKSPYVKFRIHWWGKKREEYLGEESQFKQAFKRQTTFKDFNEFLLDRGRKKFLSNLGGSAERSKMSVLQKQLKQYKLSN